MANSFSAIMPKILARGLRVLRERAVMPRLVNLDYSMEAAEKGDTIDVPISAAVGTRAVTPSNTPPAPSDTTPTKVQVTLDNWRQTDPFYMTDKEMVEIDRNAHFLPGQVEEAVKALANYVNQQIHALYVGVYGFAGTAGTDPFASTVTGATDARKVLNQQKCPLDMRRGVVNFNAEANMLALPAFSDAEKIMSPIVKLEGEIGRKYGIDWVADDHVTNHVSGTPGGTPLVNNGAGYAAGSTSIAIDGLTNTTGDYHAGDIISFASHSQTYVVTALATANGSGQVTVTIDPPLVAAITDNSAVTLKASHSVNLVFHRNAFAFATRPLATTVADLAMGRQIMSMQDPQTGLNLRLEVSRQHKQTVWEFDILFGCKLVRAALAARLAGAVST